MGIQYAGQPTISPLAAARPMPLAPAPSPMAPVAPFVTSQQSTPLAAPAMMQPSQASDDDMPEWFKAIGKTAKGIAKFAFGDQEQAVSPIADARQGAGFDQQRAAVVLRAAHTRPADTFERLSGMSVDDTIEQMRKVYEEEIPTDLDREEKGMLLMQLGFGIMAGGPGLVPALGQAGLQMMGSWQEMRAQKQRAGERQKAGQLDVLGTQARIAAGREEGEADRAARMERAQLEAQQPVQLSPGEVLLDPQTRQPLYTAPRAPEAPPEAPAMIREMQAMGYDPRNPEHQQQYFALQRGASGSDQGTALMQNAQYLARVKGISEEQAADIMLMSAAGRENPDQVRRDIYMTALRETGDANEAMRITEESMRLLSGAPMPEEAAAAPAPPGLMSRTLSAITQSARAMLAQQQAGPEVTGAIPPAAAPSAPAIGAIEDGYRFKGGDPSKPESWEAVQ